MSLQDKINSAKPTTFLTDGLSPEEVRECVKKGKEKVKLLIDIPEWLYQDIQEYLHPSPLDKVIQNGAPLPKNHGDLKDTDEIIEKIRRLPNGGRQWFVNAESVFNIILDAPTIVEADKAESEDI